MSPPPYSASSCQKILEETAPLLVLHHETLPALCRLQELIDHHFQDNSLGQDFRSLCCFGSLGHSVSLKVFNEMCILPATQCCVQLTQNESSGPVAHSVLPQIEKKKYLHDFVATAQTTISRVFMKVASADPRSKEILSYVPTDGMPKSWSLQIIDNSRNKSKATSSPKLPSLSVLRQRIERTIKLTFEARLADNQLRFFCQSTGALWNSTIDDSFDAEAIILQASSEFKVLLEDLLRETGKTLDQLAGVEVSRRYPDVEEVVRAGFEGAKLKGIHSIDLLHEDGSLGGSVISMHNAGFLSVEWLAAYLVDADQNHFMVDERALLKNNKERYLRIFAEDHDFDNPTWMQFGKTKGVYLYLSQRASAAEAGWLKIVSFVVGPLSGGSKSLPRGV